ncbi:MAG: hypothetical protein PHQ74_08320 [Crocinitomicaceae bacterium]|nr:hypothetical protein [Crocinitomicaceae bacterium]
MKIGTYILSLSILTMLFTSCKDDIDLASSSKSSAVVYGLLDASDSVHMIKINRAFVSNGNSLEVAQIPDSNYFRNVDATVTEIINGVAGRVWTLHDTLVQNKESGVFFAPEQKIYTFSTSTSAPLIANENTEYELNISLNQGEFSVQGRTKLVSGMSIQNPSTTTSYSFAKSNVATMGYDRANIKFTKGTAQVVDVSMKILYDEYIGASSTTKSFDWKISELGPSSLKTPSIQVAADGETFYRLMSKNVVENSSVTKRRINSVVLTITGGSAELQSYIEINKPSTSLAQNKPTYTNLTATNDRRVLGLFSSRQTKTLSKLEFEPLSNSIVALSQFTMKELCIGPITGHLLFCSGNPLYNPASPNNQPWYCN